MSTGLLGIIVIIIIIKVLSCFVSTDKALALSDHRCGGNVSLDREPAGHISLTLPGLHAIDQPDVNLSVCTWFIDLPVGRTVVFKLAEPGGGSNLWLHCAGAGHRRARVLEEGLESLLSGCDTNKATLTWASAGRSSLQLLYYGELPRVCVAHSDHKNVI